MLRVEFQLPVDGHLATVAERVSRVDTVELDNVVPMCDGAALFFLTVSCTEPVDVAGSLAEATDLTVRHCSRIQEAPLMSHVLVAAAFERSVLSTVVDEGAVPHRFVAAADRIDGVVSVDGWDQLRALATAIEDAHGVFDLRGTTELDRPGYPLGRDKFEYGVYDALTADQLEVLRTAYEMGHFAVPQQATSEEVAEALDISRSTLSERLRRAENDLLRLLFSDVADK